MCGVTWVCLKGWYVLRSNCVIKVSLCLSSGKESQSQSSSSQGDSSQVNGLQTEELSQLREELDELRKQHAVLQTQLAERDALITTLVSRSRRVCVC